MRARFAAPPTARSLLGSSPHEVVRDYPETLRVFRSHGVDLHVEATLPLRRLCGGSRSHPLVEDLLETLAWRGESEERG